MKDIFDPYGLGKLNEKMQTEIDKITKLNISTKIPNWPSSLFQTIERQQLPIRTPFTFFVPEIPNAVKAASSALNRASFGGTTISDVYKSVDDMLRPIQAARSSWSDLLAANQELIRQQSEIANLLNTFAIPKVGVPQWPTDSIFERNNLALTDVLSASTLNFVKRKARKIENKNVGIRDYNSAKELVSSPSFQEPDVIDKVFTLLSELDKKVDRTEQKVDTLAAKAEKEAFDADEWLLARLREFSDWFAKKTGIKIPIKTILIVIAMLAAVKGLVEFCDWITPDGEKPKQEIQTSEKTIPLYDSLNIAVEIRNRKDKRAPIICRGHKDAIVLVHTKNPVWSRVEIALDSTDLAHLGSGDTIRGWIKTAELDSTFYEVAPGKKKG